MSDIKWIKVAVDMFEDSKIEFIRSLPEGDSIIVTWIQMLSIAGKSNMGGYLLVAEGIPYTEQFLCDKLRRTPTFMQFALDTLIKLKMVNVEDGPFHITNWEKHQNVMGMDKVREQTRLRVAKHREKQQILLDNGHGNVTNNVTSNDDVTVSNATELELEIDNKKNSGPKGPVRKVFIPPTVDEVEDYCYERNKGVDPEQWYDYYTANGWKVGKNPMKDWKAAVRTWERKNTSSSTSTVGRMGQAAYTKGVVKPENPARTAEDDEWFDRYASKGKRTDA